MDTMTLQLAGYVVLTAHWSVLAFRAISQRDTMFNLASHEVGDYSVTHVSSEST